MSVAPSSAVPAPFSISPSWSWDGDDGSWSTFSISVGTPPQSFRILPSTRGSETWIPIPQGCQGVLSNVANCGNLRGANEFDGTTSQGFESNASSTWDLVGIYELATEQNLWGMTGNQGLYGLDTVTFDSNPPGRDAGLTSQTVAGVATADVWLGIAGLGIAPANFSVEKENIPSLLESMSTQNITPGLSFGYAAGASYSSSKTPGSLVIGGYDQARFKSSGLSFPTDDQTLPLSIESMVVENAFGGTLSLSDGKPITATVDSTVSQLWLPQSACDLFAQAFGLNFDSPSGFYLVNDTVHTQLRSMNPSVTFTLAGTNDSSSTTNIKFPYAAFDLQAGIPLFNTTTNYFPLRVAANESQQVLGRAFLQEAYVFVDWERTNFTIGQAIHQNSTTNIIPVLSPKYSSTSSGSSGLSTGAIVGIAVGAGAALLVAIGLATFFILRSRKKRKTKVVEALPYEKAEQPTELHDETLKPPEIMSGQLYEMEEGHSSKHELFAEQDKPTELQADSLERELEGDTQYGGQDKKKQDVYELP